MMPYPRFGAIVLALSVFAAACRTESRGTRAVRVTRSDSAGIEIVTTATQAGDVPAFATLDSTPDLRIGSVAGPVEEQFGSVRDLAVLPDGGVAVLDDQAAEIRLFGPDGAYRLTVGTKGEGPGELQAPRSITLLPADTLAVYDYRAARITRFGTDGSLGRLVTLAFEGYGRPTSVSLFPDGRVVASSLLSRPGTRVPPEGLSFTLDSTVLQLNGNDGSLRDTVAVFPWMERFRDLDISPSAVFIRLYPAAFNRSGVVTTHPDGVWCGFGDRWELRLLDPVDGHVKRILRAPGLERPLTDGEADQILQASLAQASDPEDLRARHHRYDLSPRPAMRPTYDRVLVDDQARLWLEEWPGARTESRRWWVFAQDGALSGYVEVPGDFRLDAVRGHQAWGIVRDDLDVQYVVRYVIRPGGA
ncbi:MAG: hypothetical protein LJF04_05525 [Gemmatimonadetes bacterium]|nr:hypothetical protein [Gemmatimonadota bacterium]